MQNVADQSVALTTIRADLCAIFISLELSRSTWLVTSLSPGGGEKMSKHSVSAGDIAALLARFSELRRKACARTGKSFPIVVIQEAGLDGFWIHRVLLSEGIESHVLCRWTRRFHQSNLTRSLKISRPQLFPRAWTSSPPCESPPSLIGAKPSFSASSPISAAASSSSLARNTTLLPPCTAGS